MKLQKKQNSCTLNKVASEYRKHSELRAEQILAFEAVRHQTCTSTAPSRRRSTNTLTGSCWFTFGTMECFKGQIKYRHFFHLPAIIQRIYSFALCFFASATCWSSHPSFYSLWHRVSCPLAALVLPASVSSSACWCRRWGRPWASGSCVQQRQRDERSARMKCSWTGRKWRMTRQRRVGRAGLLFVGDLIPGFSRHRRHFLRVRVDLAFLILFVIPFNLQEVKKKQQLRNHDSTAPSLNQP